MRKHLISVVLGLVVACLTVSPALAGDSWLMDGRNAQATRFNPGEHTIRSTNVVRLHTVWSFPGSTALTTGSLVFAISLCKVVALDIRTGVVHRTLLRGTTTSCPQALAYGKGRLVVALGRSVVAISPQSGRLFWRANAMATWLALSGQSVYTGSGCQSTPQICGKPTSAAINLRTGKIRWKKSENFGGQPILIAGLLYRSVGNFWGETRVYDPVSGSLLSNIRFLHAQWVGDADNAFADVATGPLQKSWLGRIDETGKPTWKVDLGKVNPRDAPAYAYNILFVPSNRHHPGVIAVNPDDGRVLWATDLALNLRLAVADHLLFVLEVDSGRLNVLDAGTGRILVRVTLPNYRGSETTDLLVAGGSVIVPDGKRITALRTGPFLR